MYINTPQEVRDRKIRRAVRTGALPQTLAVSQIHQALLLCIISLIGFPELIA